MGVAVTGASVEIRTHVPSITEMQSSISEAGTSFWVGLDFPNDAFIQVGYTSWPNTGSSYPQRFWEYYPPKTASAGGGVFHGDFQGDEVGPDGAWYTYAMWSQGDTWSFYINNILDGSYNVGASSSSGTLSAVAEVEGAYTTHTILGPTEFRDFAYRDTNNVWHNVSSAIGYVGLGAGSGTLPSEITNPYGLQVLSTNDWMAGSGLPQIRNNQVLWANAQSVATSVYYPPPTTAYTYEPFVSSSESIGQGALQSFFPTNPGNILVIAVIVALVIGAVIYFWPISGRAKSKQAKLDSVLSLQPTAKPEPELQPSAKQAKRVKPEAEISATKVSPDMMFCKECGSRISRDSKFCKECGTKQT